MTNFPKGSQFLFEPRVVKYLVDELVRTQYGDILANEVEFVDGTIQSSKLAVGCGFGSDLDVRYISQQAEQVCRRLWNRLQRALRRHDEVIEMDESPRF